MCGGHKDKKIIYNLRRELHLFFVIPFESLIGKIMYVKILIMKVSACHSISNMVAFCFRLKPLRFIYVRQGDTPVTSPAERSFFVIACGNSLERVGECPIGFGPLGHTLNYTLLQIYVNFIQ